MEKPIIGIIVHNDIEPFEWAISSLMATTRYYSKIIIIESGSTDGCDKFFDKLT